MRAAERYLYRAAAWAREVIDWGEEGGITVYQGDILSALTRHRRVAARGPHGLGKTAPRPGRPGWRAVQQRRTAGGSASDRSAKGP
ncbi:hypothetical protein [Streptomyces mirabilis]